MLNKPLKIILIWLFAEAIIWIPYRNLIGYDKALIAVFYFLFFSIVTIFLFKDIFYRLVKSTRINKYLFLLGSFTSHGLVYWFCNTQLTAPLELIISSPASYTLVNSYFLYGKPFDILIQQLMLIVLVIKLDQEKVSSKYIMLTTVLIFGLAHVEALRRMNLIYGLALTTVATTMAIIIPKLILKVKDGYIYSFILHLTFVDIAALLAWIFF